MAGIDKQPVVGAQDVEEFDGDPLCHTPAKVITAP